MRRFRKQLLIGGCNKNLEQHAKSSYLQEMTFRIGRRIRQLCTLLEQGSMTSVELREAFPDIEISNVNKYMTRAESYGFVTRRKMGTENLWTIVPGWNPEKPVKVVKPKPVRQFATKAVNSVWGLAAQ